MNRREFIQHGMVFGAFAAVAGMSAVVPAMAAGDADAAAALLAQSYPDLDGKPRPLAEWRGKPMVINFWATWCAPCVKEMPELDTLQKQHSKAQFVGIGIDSATNMQKFAQKVSVSYPLLVAGPGGIDLMRKLGNGPGALPFTVILAEDGSVKRTILGPADPEEVAALLHQLGA
jgi:thiol-disulfide isomerase/thioredoxin